MERHNLRLLWILILLPALGCSSGDIQTEETYSILGQVLDEAGDPAADVPICLLFAVPSSEPGWPPEDYRGVADDFVDSLRVNHPNPAIDITHIAYQIVEPCICSLRILDGHGSLVRTLLEDYSAQVGQYESTWNLRDDEGVRLPNGIYHSRLELVRQDSMKRFISEPILINFIATSDFEPYVQTDGEGRFEIPYDDLHIGAEIPYTTDFSTPETWYTLPDSLWIQAGGSQAWTRLKVQVADLVSNQSVTLQLPAP